MTLPFLVFLAYFGLAVAVLAAVCGLVLDYNCYTETIYTKTILAGLAVFFVSGGLSVMIDEFPGIPP